MQSPQCFGFFAVWLIYACLIFIFFKGETSVPDGDGGGGFHSLKVDRYVIGQVIQSQKQNLEK